MVSLRDKRRMLNFATSALLVLVYLIIEGLLKLDILTSYDMQIISLVNINIILVVSLNLINGFTGQFSIGHAGFFGVGAYLSAYLTKSIGVPYFLALLCAAAAAALIGIAIGLPALRLRGDYLAIATLGFGEIIRIIILNIPSVGGARGFSGIPNYTSFGLTYLLAIITVVVIKNFIQSKHGRACVAIREDEIASESLGINTTYYKVVAFAIGALFAGLAGGLFVHYMQYISPTTGQIGFLKSIDILIMLVFGGLGSITGSIVAAIVLTLLPELLRGFAEYRMIIYPIILIIMMIFRPSGLLGGKELSYDYLIKVYQKLQNKLKKQEVTAGGN